MADDRQVSPFPGCSMEWRTDLVPRIILDKLEGVGYTLHSMTGVGQTCIFTCHRLPTAAEEGDAGAEAAAVAVAELNVNGHK